MTQTPSDRIDETHRDFVAALARGLSVIQAFSENQPEMTLSEVAQAAQMNVATARRALLTLHSLGYVGMQGKRFLLLPKVLSLGVAYLRSMNFKDLVNPYLQEVADEYRDSVSFAVLDGDVDVRAEDEQLPGEVLHVVLHAEVALERRDFLLLPRRERV